MFLSLCIYILCLYVVVVMVARHETMFNLLNIFHRLTDSSVLLLKERKKCIGNLSFAAAKLTKLFLVETIKKKKNYDEEEEEEIVVEKRTVEEYSVQKLREITQHIILFATRSKFRACAELVTLLAGVTPLQYFPVSFQLMS